MKIESALVVYKRTAYEEYCEVERDARVTQLVTEGHFTAHGLIKAHQEHRETMERVGSALEELKLAYRFVRRADLRETLSHDLVIAVGGDGTFLDASHHVLDKPMLGVNSSPSFSVGIFCGATSKTFKTTLADVLRGKARVTLLNRNCLMLNGNAIIEPVLNEALVCAQNPAQTSRYVLEIGKKREDQKSSGIYVGPAAGSTAAMRAAGGAVLPIASKKVQYVVREPYKEPSVKNLLLRGLLPPKGGLRIWSKMRSGMIFVDGPHVRYRFDFGDELAIVPEHMPLAVFGIPAKRK